MWNLSLELQQELLSELLYWQSYFVKQINILSISGINYSWLFFLFEIFTTPTQWLQLLNGFLPDGLDMDAAETPLWGNLNQVGPFKAIGLHFFHILLILKQVLAVCEIPSGLRETKEWLIEVKAVMEVSETVRSLVVVLILIGLTELIVVCSAVLTRQDLEEQKMV